MLDLGVKLLSEVVCFNKYSKYVPELNRRETWEEICLRNMNMHLSKYPQLETDIKRVYSDFIVTKKILPSMRALQFGGKPIELANNRLYNCCLGLADHYKFFSETMFLLLGGSGVGYSVQKQHVAKLAKVRTPKSSQRFLIQDSIIGWADAVKELFGAYLAGGVRPEFDYRDIRAKGSLLKTTGGRAPGPTPLRLSLEHCETLLKNAIGRKLKPLEVHDALCYIADAVLSGGIRRAAMISFFSPSDDEMALCKDGEWYVENPQRGRANNSAVLLRKDLDPLTGLCNKVLGNQTQTTEKEFFSLWEKTKATKSGEPGFYWTNDLDSLSNPCVEISLRAFSFCNLTTVNVSTIVDQEDLNERVAAAAFIGTLQAGYTDFHYLRPIWKKTTEEDALLGVSMTGIASSKVLGLDMAQAAIVVKQENEAVAKMIGIRSAARTTCVKPEGTSSLVLGSSSGIHAWHAPYYIRRMRVNKGEPIYRYLNDVVPELLEDEVFKPELEAVLSVPVKAPDGAVFRSESAVEFLERVKKVSKEWVLPGHRDGVNTHNVSATVNIREDEWDICGKWIWDNRDCYNGLSVIPYSDPNYKQLPFEECDELTYQRLSGFLKAIDLTQVREFEDTTSVAEELSCVGGACVI